MKKFMLALLAAAALAVLVGCENAAEGGKKSPVGTWQGTKLAGDGVTLTVVLTLAGDQTCTLLHTAAYGSGSFDNFTYSGTWAQSGDTISCTVTAPGDDSSERLACSYSGGDTLTLLDFYGTTLTLSRQ